MNVYGIASSIIYLLNHKREEISFIESKYSIKLNFSIDRDATSDSYSIEKVKLPDKHRNNDISHSPALQDTSEIYNEAEEKAYPKNRRKIDKNKELHNKKEAQPTEASKNENNLEKETQKPSPPEKPEQNSNAKRKRVHKQRKKITKKEPGKANQTKEKPSIASKETSGEPEAS